MIEPARLVAIGLAFIHVVFSFGHFSLLDPETRAAVTAVTTTAATVLVSTAILLGRWRPPTRHAHTLAFFVMAVTLVSAITVLALAGRPEYTTNISLLAMAAGLWFLSTAWLAAFLWLALGLWLAASRFAPDDGVAWGFFLVGLVASFAVAAGTHLVRLRALTRAERARREADERARALGASEERYALSVAGANDGLYDWNLRTGKSYLSARFKAILGFADDELPNDTDAIAARIHPDDADRVRARIIDHLKGLTPHFEDEYRVLHKDGTYRWVLSRGVTVRDDRGRAIRMAGSLTDMTGRGVFDPLTGLPNRLLLLDRLRRICARTARHGTHSALLFLDLDRFKIINDSLGHHAGDELLIQVARRLNAAVRASDTVARLGGDEFVVILEELAESDLEPSMRRVEEHVSGGYRVGDREIYVTASIGAVVDTSAYRSADDLLRDADTAMYQAKHRKQARVVFDADMREAVHQRLDAENEIRNALAKDQFSLLFQPIIALETGEIRAVAAESRWNRPGLGPTEPRHYLPIMEETGLVLPFGSWLLLEACLQLVAWDAVRRTGAPPAVAVQIPTRLITHPDLVREVAEVLERTGFEPWRLILEISESAITTTAEAATSTIRDLRALGVHLMMNDFGTGQSLSAALQRLPIDSLRIDRSFVARVPTDPHALELVRAMIAVGRNLGVEIVAGGIESHEQRLALRELGCQMGQGNLFGVPAALGSLEAASLTVGA